MGAGHAHFRPKTQEAFAEGFAVLLMACRGLGDGWVTDSIGGPDVIGSVYMDLLERTRYNYIGQFFSPWNVCLMMSKMGKKRLTRETNAERIPFPVPYPWDPDVTTGQPRWPAAFKIRFVISCGCEIREI